MNISKPFVTESRSHAKKIISKGFWLTFQRKSFFFHRKKSEKKKDNDLNNILSLPSSSQRNSIKLLFVSKALILRY